MPDDVSSDPPDTTPSHPARSRAQVAYVLGLCALGIAAAVAVLVLAIQVHRQHENDRARDDAVAVAKAQALNLLGLTSKDVNQRIDFLLAHSTGSFHSQLSNIRSSFGQMVKQNNISSAGKVDLAAVESSSASKATVLLALSSTVTNSQSKSPQQRAYRISVKLVRSGSQWLVVEMGFSS